MSESQGKTVVGEVNAANWLELVKQHVASLQFGTVEIVVQDSRVIQIQRTERVRLDKRGT